MAFARFRFGLVVVASLTLLSSALNFARVGAQEKPATASAEKGLPLKPERKIAFETDEGTWVSLDVSPDGAQIAFELVGDIWALPIGGGEARAISTGMAFDSQPRFSPDGKQLAFLSDRDGAENLWIMKSDGTEPKQLTKEKQASFASPAWTEDGQSVVVSRNVPGLRTFELWIYDTRGGSGLQVTKAKPQTRHSGPRDAQRARRRGLEGWTVFLLRNQERRLRVQPFVPALADRAQGPSFGR